MEEIIELRDMLEELLETANENLGGEQVQPYLIILEGILEGIVRELENNIDSLANY